MEREKFVNEIKDWLCDTGAVRDLQTKLRKELIDSISSRGKRTIKRPDKTKGSDKALNLLIIEHLMRREMWYTASVMAKEADFDENLAAPKVEETILVDHSALTSSQDQRKGTKTHSPVKIDEQTVTEAFKIISKNSMKSELLTQLVGSNYYRKKESSVLELTLESLASNMCMNTNKTSQVEPPMTHCMGSQTQPIKETATKSVQTKDNLIQELDDLKEEIFSLKEEKLELEQKLQLAIRSANMRVDPQIQQMHFPPAGPKPNVEHLINDIRSKVNQLSTANESIMSQISMTNQ